MTNYAANIVVLQLDKIITLSHEVLPACVRWTANGVSSPSENATAKVLVDFGYCLYINKMAIRLRWVFL